MNALLGVALFAAATVYAMDMKTELDFDHLRMLVNTAQAYKEEPSIKIYGLNPLITAICKGKLSEVMNLINNRSELMHESVQGLFPIHWSVIAKEDEIYDFLAKQPGNLGQKTTDGLTAFQLSIKYASWNKEQIEKRELKDYYREG